jgi:hypothetical protein
VLLTARLTQNLERTGFFDYFLTFSYHAAAASARFDTISHILPAHVTFSSCSQYATSSVAGCSANYRPGARAAARPKAQRAAMVTLLRYLLR